MSEKSPLEDSQGLTLAILGCGKMGTAIIRGLLSALPDTSRPSSSTIASPSPAPKSNPLFTTIIACTRTLSSSTHLKAALPQQPNLKILQNNNLHGIHQAAVVILAIKPASLSSLLASAPVRAALRDKLLISLVGGLSAERIKSLLQPDRTATTTISEASSISAESRTQESAHNRVVVAIPNLAASVHASMTVIAQPEPPLSKGDNASLSWIFSHLGHFKYVAAASMNGAMVLSSAGVAFMALVVEALAKGGEAVGIEGSDGVEMAARAAEGMARLVIAGEEPAMVRQRVATPGGITMEGLRALEEGNLMRIVVEAVMRAEEKANRVGG